LLGRAIKKHGRDKFIVATKFGILPGSDGQPAPNSSEEIMRKQLQDSLTRLGIDCIDLYYQHRPDPNTPMEDVIRVLKTFIDEGKIKYIGLSEMTAEELRRAHAVHPISAIQMEYSLQTRDIEQNNILATARELGVGIVAYSPLGRGFLTTKLVDINQLDANDWRRTTPRFAAENFEQNAQLEQFKVAAEKKGCTPGQLALAWLYAQGRLTLDVSCCPVIPFPSFSEMVVTQYEFLL
jgi:aryl-alcohol dehydrogenase-like predicted oxidoreductase